MNHIFKAIALKIEQFDSNDILPLVGVTLIGISVIAACFSK